MEINRSIRITLSKEDIEELMNEGCLTMENVELHFEDCDYWKEFLVVEKDRHEIN